MRVFALLFCISLAILVPNLSISALAQDDSCPDYFTGNLCTVCTDDKGCQASWSPDATCNNSPIYSNYTAVKSYSCTLNDPFLGELIDPSTLLVQCYTGIDVNNTGTPPPEPSSEGVPPSPPPPYISIVPPAPPPPPVVPPADPTNDTNTENRRRKLLQEFISKLNHDSSILDPYLNNNNNNNNKQRVLLQDGVGEAGPQTAPYCEISFKVMDPSVQVKCKAENCGIKLDNGDPIRCSSTTCVCPDSANCGGGGLTNTLVTSVTGASSLECAKPAAGQVLTSNDRQACTLRIGGLPVDSIAADCIIGDCQQPSGSSFNGSDADNSVENLYTNAVVAAIPAIILTFIVAVVGFYALFHKQLWSYDIGAEDMVALDKLAESNTLPETMDHRVESLEFHNVSMWVPMSKKEATRKRHALYTKAVARTETASAPTPTVDADATHLKKSGSGGSGNGHITTTTTTNTGAGGFIRRAALQLHRRTSGTEDVEASGDDVTIPKESKAAAEYVCSLHNSTETPEQWYILRQCHGRVDSGQVVGVLGPSGGGKTSLLGAIAGSALDLGNTAVLTGKVYVDGRPRKNSDVAFVPQADLLIPSLTVAECLRYSAMLRLPANTPPLDLQLRIDMALDELGLKHVADSQVGGSGGIRGVSGGERRRVTIGMELVTNPGVIILDEPTSGLDSYTALNLMTTLHSVASHGRVVIASLHQPSGDMLLGLDQVILMGHGRMLFMGPPKSAAGVFAARGLPCPPNSAIAEHMLNVASSPRDVQQLLLADDDDDDDGNNGVGKGGGAAIAGGAESQRTTTSDESVDTWVASTNNGGNVVTKRTVSTSRAVTNGSTATNTAALKAFAKPGFWRQLTVLFWRTLIDIWRNPILLRLHFFMSAFMGIVMGLVFWNVDDTNIGVQNRLGGTFFALAFLGFTSLTTVDLLMNERGVVMREVRGGYYSPITYMLSKVALDGLLLRCIPALVYWAPFYYMAGFRYESAYAATWLFILVAFNCVVGAMSMCVTVASSTAGQASFIMNFLLLFSVVFTGFLVNVSSIPVWIRWLHYLSVFYYAFEAMVMTEILGGSYDFKASSIGAAVKGVKGSVYLSDVLGLNTGNTTEDIGILIAYWAGFILLALVIFMVRLPRTSDGTTSGWRKILGKMKCW